MVDMKTKGKCYYCGQLFTKLRMAKHLLSCDKRKEREKFVSKQRNTNFFLIRAEQEPYWLYIQIPSFYTLDDLDQLLRREWLECCGHLSCFKINNTTFDCYHDGGEDIWGEIPETMDIKLRDVLTPGIRFTHDYDYGTTTQLKLKLIEAYKSPFAPQISILAQNNPPNYVCESCSNPAERICTFCHEYSCHKCVPNHDCGWSEDPEGIMYPLVNSPRTGLCGYLGKEHIDRIF